MGSEWGRFVHTFFPPFSRYPDCSWKTRERETRSVCTIPLPIFLLLYIGSNVPANEHVAQASRAMCFKVAMFYDLIRSNSTVICLPLRANILLDASVFVGTHSLSKFCVLTFTFNHSAVSSCGCGR